MLSIQKNSWYHSGLLAGMECVICRVILPILPLITIACLWVEYTFLLLTWGFAIWVALHNGMFIFLYTNLSCVPIDKCTLICALYLYIKIEMYSIYIFYIFVSIYFHIFIIHLYMFICNLYANIYLLKHWIPKH